MDKICVVGLGYIGLPTALMLAAHGIPITGVDKNEKLVGMLQQSVLMFEEKGLDKLFDAALERGITFENKLPSAEFYIVAVPTPYDKVTKKIDAAYVVSAVKDVLQVCQKGAIIVIESTVSPGTIDRYVRPALEQVGFVAGQDVHLAHAPERIIPGNMVYELEYNSRTVGADESDIGQQVKKVYSSFCKGEIVVTSIRTAEMTKVVENTFRDINIAFANELCKICRQDNLDVYEIIRIANKHPRVNILQPGPGVGGHCISVDPWFLVGDYPGLSLLIHEARKINDSMPDHVLGRIRFIMKEQGLADNSRVGLYGLTYKEDVDDIRESPTLQLLERVEANMGAPLAVYDPMLAEDMVPRQYHDFDHFLNDMDMIVIMTAHSHIRKHINKLHDKVILDTRNIDGLIDGYKL